MKILAQIAPLTALFALALSGVGCVSAAADDGSAAGRTGEAAQADADDAPPWQGGPYTAPPTGTPGFLPPYWAGGEGVQLPGVGSTQWGDWNGGHGVAFPPSYVGGAGGFWPSFGDHDGWRSSRDPSWSGQGYGGHTFGFAPSYGGPWQGAVVPSAGDGGHHDRR